MRRYRTIVIILAAVLLSFGCHREPKQYKIGVSQCSSDDWRSKCNQEIEREMFLHNNATVEIRSAEDNSDKQIKDIDYFVKNKFDLIIVAPNEAKSLTPVIRDVYNKGIPVIIFDRDINDTTYTAYIGVDNKELGHKAARYAANLLPQGPVNVLEVRGLDDSTPARDRNLGFKSACDSIPRMNIVATCSGRWLKDEAQRAVLATLRQHPETNLIYAHNDRMAIGAREATKSLGRDDIKVIGIDAAPNIGIKAVKEGVIDATFLYPTDGNIIIKRALEILEGKPYPKKEMLPIAGAVDRSNADMMMLLNLSITDETSKVKYLKGKVDEYWEKHSIQNAFLYALIALIIMISIVVFLLLRSVWTARRHHCILRETNQMLAEERDKQKDLYRQLAEATNSKLIFFTNASHDLRTPLTIISEPVERMIRNPDMNADERKLLLQLVDKNVKILRRLVNQILDFRKYENDKIDLQMTECDLTALSTEWTEAFRDFANRHHIKYSVTLPTASVMTAIDEEKIQRVVFNLLSNAFKHTPYGGEVTYSCSVESNTLVIQVTNTGDGISKEDLLHIFERYYQAGRIHSEGTGIGLALTKAFVMLHHGDISADSKEGEITTFTVRFPITHTPDNPEGEHTPKMDESLRDGALAAIESIDNLDLESESQDDRPLMLIIDDNSDMRLLISTLMNDDYRCITAPDGKEGIRMAIKYVPDIIICDVMMPRIDGYECVKRLKNDITTSHIPMLLLTACAEDEKKVEGYNCGAEGYISKPFSGELLKATCRSLMENRKRIRDIYTSDITTAMHSDIPESDKSKSEPNMALQAAIGGNADSEFYGLFLKILDEKLGNSQLSVEELASDMGLGRSQFYRKIKSLTGYSPVEIIRKHRLKKARKMLVSTDRTISEIAYSTGFSTPAYFTKCFRDEYSVTPSELRENPA